MLAFLAITTARMPACSLEGSIRPFPPALLSPLNRGPGTMDAKKRPCPACGQLEECNLELSWAQLEWGAGNGCGLCFVLKAGLLGFVPDAAEKADRLALSVDVSLFVSLFGEDKKQLMVVE